MSNLAHVLETVESLSPAERISVMEKILGLMRADAAVTGQSIAATALAGAIAGVKKGTGDLGGDPYDMKGEGA